MKRKFLRLVLTCLIMACTGVVAIWIVFAACTRTVEIAIPTIAGDHTPGALHKVEQIGSYTGSMLRFLVWWGKLPEPISVRHGATLYRVQYWTTAPGGSATIASGLVCVPKGGPPRGVVSYQHGTTVNRHLTPSAPTLLESGLGTAIFAGGGYILCAADYVGLGTNREVHPYLHAQGTANSVIDLLKAANAFAKHLEVKWPTSLYLVGFSQGGYSTLAAHRALESLNDPRFHVVACAPIAGVFNLADITFPVFLESTNVYHSMYLAYLANAYSSAYGHPLNSVLTDSYAASVPALFDGEHDEWVVAQNLPNQPRTIFRKEFLDAYDNKQPTWFTTALAENEVFRWTPKAPVQLYYSERDSVVSPRDPKVAASEFEQRGCNVTLIESGAPDHGGTILLAIPKVRQWFDSMTEGNGG